MHQQWMQTNNDSARPQGLSLAPSRRHGFRGRRGPARPASDYTYTVPPRSPISSSATTRSHVGQYQRVSRVDPHAP